MYLKLFSKNATRFFFNFSISKRIPLAAMEKESIFSPVKEETVFSPVKEETSESSFHAGQKRLHSPPPPNEEEEKITPNPVEDRGGQRQKKQRPNYVRLPKRKVAIMMGFSGTGYSGMQLNPRVKTIEGDFFDALVKAGAVSEDNSDNPKKVGFMRAARTDKGVHAAVNVISMKLCVDIEDLVKKVNDNLPEQIRMWGYTRVFKNFHSRTYCDSRIYEYLLPTYVFLPPSAQKPELMTNPTGYRYIPKATPEEMAKVRQYRIPAETLERVRMAFKLYEGTKNFHNFTVGKSFKDFTAKRYIIKFEVSEPKYIQDTEWLSLTVHGQSFMFHQIRKMVGLVILIVRTSTPLTLIPKTFGPEKINVPRAPALGLLLEKPIFAAYNTKATEDQRDTIDPEKYREEINAFKEKWIYERMFEEEFKMNTFDEWVKGIEANEGDDFGYLNPEGNIPDSAIIISKKGKDQNTAVKGTQGGARDLDSEEEEEEILGDDAEG